MVLTEDELERVAAAYHQACRRKRGEKIALYMAAKTVPELSALQAAPMDWADAVATVIADIIYERETANTTS